MTDGRFTRGGWEKGNEAESIIHLRSAEIPAPAGWWSRQPTGAERAPGRRFSARPSPPRPRSALPTPGGRGPWAVNRGCRCGRRRPDARRHPAPAADQRSAAGTRQGGRPPTPRRKAVGPVPERPGAEAGCRHLPPLWPCRAHARVQLAGPAPRCRPRTPWTGVGRQPSLHCPFDLTSADGSSADSRAASSLCSMAYRMRLALPRSPPCLTPWNRPPWAPPSPVK